MSKVSLEFRSVIIDDVRTGPFSSEFVRQPQYWVHAREGEKKDKSNIYVIYPRIMGQHYKSLSIDAYLENSSTSIHLGDVDLSDLGTDVGAKIEREAKEVYAAAVRFGQDKAKELGVEFEDLTKKVDRKE